MQNPSKLFSTKTFGRNINVRGDTLIGTQLIYLQKVLDTKSGKKLLALVFAKELIQPIGCQTILQNPKISNINARICSTYFDTHGNYLIIFDDKTKDSLVRHVRTHLLQQLHPT